MHDGDDQAPAPNSAWAAASQATPASAPTATAPSGPRRNAAASGAQRGHEHDQRGADEPPGERSGSPASTVAIALPWTSGPDISDPSVVEVVDTSLSRERLGAHDDDLVRGTSPAARVRAAPASTSRTRRVRGGPA